MERISHGAIYTGACCWVIGARDSNGNYGLAYTDGDEIWGFRPCNCKTAMNIGS